jgi:hypothetical protein
MSEEMVTITTKEYNELLERDQWLCALECAGVDNWGGIDNARDTLNERKEEEND